MLPIAKNKEVIAPVKDELRGKIMVEFAGLIVKTYPYLMVDVVNIRKLKEEKSM